MFQGVNDKSGVDRIAYVEGKNSNRDRPMFMSVISSSSRICARLTLDESEKDY